MTALTALGMTAILAAIALFFLWRVAPDWILIRDAGFKYIPFGFACLLAGLALNAFLLATMSLDPLSQAEVGMWYYIGGSAGLLGCLSLAIGTYRDLVTAKSLTVNAEVAEGHTQPSADALLLSTVPAMLFRTSEGATNQNPTVEFINDKVEEMLGYTMEDFRSEPELLFNIMHPDDKANYETSERATIWQSKRYVLEHRFRHKDGEYRWIRRHLRRTYNVTSARGEWIGCGFDITDLKEAEARLVNFLEAAPDPVVTANDRAEIVLVNAQAELLFGYTRAELLGRHIRTLLAEHERTHKSQQFSAFLSDSSCQSTGARIELCAVRKDSSQFPVEVSFSPLISGQETLIAFAVRDISKRKQTEAQLQQAQKMEAVGQLTGGVAHDFNNLLTVVIGNLQLLELSCVQDDSVQQATNAALDAAHRGAELTRRLLAFSRQQLLAPKVTRVNELIDGIEPLLQRTLGEDINLSTSLSDGLWLTRVDPGQLENAMINLAINARDAMAGGGRLTIETTNATLDADYASQYTDLSHGEYVLITVNDNGAGISSEALPHVFDPFFSTKEVGKGSGLGLSMVHGFVKQSKGHIKIYSEDGHGTVVKVYLPRSLSATEVPEETTVSRKGIPNGDEVILLVEDEPAVREVAVNLLNLLGYRVFQAENGPDALEFLDSGEKIDLLFTDIVMPGGMTGVELARHARKRNSNLRVLYTSGYTNTVVFDNGLLQPGDVVLNKPYRKDELAQCVRDVLDRE